MRHASKSSRLGVKSGHRLAMLRNLSLGLVEHGRIKTTTTRAKVLRAFLEPIVTRLKDPSLHNIRIALSQLPNEGAVMQIAKTIAPKFKTRPGGYLRVLKLAKARVGDCADMSLIEWVDESLVGAYQDKPSASKKAGGKKAGKAPAKEAKAASASAKSDDAETSGAEKKAAKKPAKKAASK